MVDSPVGTSSERARDGVNCARVKRRTIDALNAALTGNQGERRDQGDDQVKDGKTT